MYINIRKGICIHTQRTLMKIFISTDIFKCVKIYTSIHIHIYTHTFIHTYIHTYTHTPMYT